MYAIVRTGGKQYKVQPGDLVRVEKLEKDLGSEFDITEVLLVGGDKTYVGEPLVKNAKVSVVVTQQAKASKIVVFKKRRRQGYRRTQGHRQLFTELFVKAITSPDGTVKSDKNYNVVDPAKKAERLAKMAEKKAAQPKVKKADRKAAAPAKKAAAKKTAAKGGAKKAGAAKGKAKAKKPAAKKAKK